MLRPAAAPPRPRRHETTNLYPLDFPSATDNNNVATYFLQDGLGSTTGLTDDEGSMTDTYTYDVFGATRSHTSASANRWLFTGEMNDSTVGRSPYYLRARYYDPAVGRFLSQDPWLGNPMNPQSLNRYPYVWNNPALYADPYGYWGGPLGKIGGAIVDKTGDVVEKVGDYLSDPENLASTIQLGSQVVASITCPAAITGVGTPIGAAGCIISVSVYGAATGARAALADSSVEKTVIAGTGAFGFCTSTMPFFAGRRGVGIGANALNQAVDLWFGDTVPVSAAAKGPNVAYSTNPSNGLSCPVGIGGEKYGSQ